MARSLSPERQAEVGLADQEKLLERIADFCEKKIIAGPAGAPAFKAEVYFFNTTRFTDLKWGTKNPIILRDPEFGPTRLRAFGTYAVKVSDPARFLSEIVGTDGEFTMDEISYQIRNIIVQEFSRVVAGSGIPVLDMAANTADLGKLIAAEISGTLAEYGLEMPELYIENISLPPAA